MSLCYEVITQIKTVATGATGLETYRVTVPTGKVPMSGGWSSTVLDIIESSYPDGNDWVFIFKNLDIAGGYNITLFVACV